MHPGTTHPEEDDKLVRFTADVGEVPNARRWVVQEAAVAGAHDETLRIVALLASELVTNAVQHGPAGGEVGVAVERRRGRLRVAVCDQSPVPPVPLNPGPTALSGRGVMLVERLAEAWGVDGKGHGKAVWFEVPI